MLCDGCQRFDRDGRRAGSRKVEKGREGDDHRTLPSGAVQRWRVLAALGGDHDRSANQL
jgi:hypothetical protein